MSSTTKLDVKDYYEDRWLEPGAYSHPPGPRLLQLLETHLTPASQCLDVGCGDGHILGPWISSRALRYAGVDISNNAVSHAQAMGLDVRVIQDATELPFESDSFDLVMCMEVLEHLFLPHLVAQETLRVLKPDGVFIATVPNLAHWRHRLEFCLIGKWDPKGDALSVDQPWRDPHIRFFSQSTLRQMLHQAGYDNPKVIGEEPVRLRGLPWLGKQLSRPSSAAFLPACFSHNLIAVAFKPRI